MQAELTETKTDNRQKLNDLIAYCRQQSSLEHKTLAIRLEKCGTKSTWKNTRTGQVGTNVQHCDSRVCPCCQRRKQRKFERDAKHWLRHLIETSNHRFIVLTIGFQNATIEQASKELKAINKGLTALYKSSRWPGKGCITSREFTAPEMQLHFNVHIIIAVDRAYFTPGQYLNHSQWCEMVQKAFKLPQSPHVYIRAVKDESTQITFKTLSNTLKYISKPLPYADSPELTVTLSKQLECTKRITFTGIFRDVLRWVRDNIKGLRDKAAEFFDNKKAGKTVNAVPEPVITDSYNNV